MNVWRLMVHHTNTAYALQWAKQMGRLAIGWGGVGSLPNFASADEITEAIKTHYPHLHNAGSGGVCLYDFCHRMQRGDLVILSTGKRILVMEITGDYEYKTQPEPMPLGPYQHQRTARQVPIDPDKLWQQAGAKPIVTHNIRWTLIQCLRSLNEADKTALMEDQNPSDG